MTRTVATPSTGYICKQCGGPSPVGIGYAASSAHDGDVTACRCGYSRIHTETTTAGDVIAVALTVRDVDTDYAEVISPYLDVVERLGYWGAFQVLQSEAGSDWPDVRDVIRAALEAMDATRSPMARALTPLFVPF